MPPTIVPPKPDQSNDEAAGAVVAADSSMPSARAAAFEMDLDKLGLDADLGLGPSILKKSKRAAASDNFVSRLQDDQRAAGQGVKPGKPSLL